MRVREVRLHPAGFSMMVPRGAPWTEGKATLSFAGREVFVGDVSLLQSGESVLAVERALPVLPHMAQRSPASEETQEVLMRRLVAEVARRGVAIPVVPEIPPPPTEGARIRMAGAAALRNDIVGGGLYKDD
jgi:hypothetical protein